VSRFKKNYDPVSDDMRILAEGLDGADNEEIFKTPAVRVWIEYLWRSNGVFHQYTLAFYSILMIFLSTYVYIDERVLPLEILLLLFAGCFLAYDIL
jgi:hypothetical protein